MASCCNKHSLFVSKLKCLFNMKSREEVTSFQLTLYPAHSQVSRGNLVLREFEILHCVLNGRNQRRALPQQ